MEHFERADEDVRVPALVRGSVDQPLTLSPKVMWLWRISWAVATVVFGIAAFLFAVVLTDNEIGRVALPVAVVALGVACGVFVPRVKYRRWSYWITDEAIELRHGVFIRSESSIPHFRVQHIDLKQGPLERAAGVMEVVISTASAATDATLPGVEKQQARVIREVVLARADADDAV